jgi:hypothetical protein
MGFDVPVTVYCQDVTPPEFKKHNTYERLVEARIPITPQFACQDKDVVDIIVPVHRCCVI